MNKNHRLMIVILAILILSAAVLAGIRQFTTGFDDIWGKKYNPQAQQPAAPSNSLQLISAPTSSVLRWNEIAVNASGLDHTPVAPGDPRVFGEQLGPGRSSRAMAIVHIAIFEAVNAIDGSCQSYTGIGRVSAGTSMDAAVEQAAHDALVAMFPSQRTSFDTSLTTDLALIPNGPGKADGINLGRRAAKSILNLRAGDGAQITEPRLGIGFFSSDQAGKWRQDPISLIPVALGAHWGEVKPFVMLSASQFRCPPPPAINTPEYAAAFNEVTALGGDGVITPTSRSLEQTQIGIFWAYDGTPSLCAPPRLYNQIAVHIAQQMGTNTVDMARLLALINTAMAEAGTAIWESKYFYQYWRPVTGIRESDPGTGPSGTGDGNPDTIGNTSFSPLGAPASNLTGPDFTPPFPAYPSGHAGFGGALFQILRKFYGTDNIPFTFVSDEFNGSTKDNDGNVRPLAPRSFATLSQAEEENGQSRIYLGIHWSFDKSRGIEQGRKVADFVFKRAFQKK